MSTDSSIESHHKLPDIHQSWWQLAAIQLTGVTSLPVLASSVLILQNCNFLSAIITLIIGNILLWVIRYGIIAMSQQGRKSALDISRDYFGNIGAFLIAILLLVSTLAWFVMQTTLASNALTFLIPIEQGLGINRFMQVGVLIGILSTLFCMNGIVVIRWVSVISLPILFVAFLAIIFSSTPTIPLENQNGFSLSGLPIILGTSLGITVDIPTFFRHSRSKKDSIHALTAIQLISLAIGIGGLFLSSILQPWFGINTHHEIHGLFLKSSLVVFIFISAICTNISNVYSSSVGWELIAPILAGIKEYLILGLGLTISFILIANVISMNFLASVTDASLVNLCLVLVFGYIIFLKVKRPPNIFEQGTYFIAWLVATVLNIFQYSDGLTKMIPPLFLGLFVMLIIIGLSFWLMPIFNKKEKL